MVLPRKREAASERWLRENSALLGTVRVPRRFLKSHTAIIGSTGSGKTTSLLVMADSVFGYIPDRVETVNGFVSDPKNQLYRSLIARNYGLPVILTNVMDRRSWAWAMWRDLRYNGGPAAAEQFAYTAIPDERPGGSNNPFFTDGPRQILGGVLRECVNLGRPWTLRQAYLLSMNWSYAERLFRRSCDQVVRDKLALIARDQGVTRANLHASLLTKLGNMATYAALMEHAPRSFSVMETLRSDVLVVLGSDFRFSHILGPMNALLMQVVREQLLSRPEDPEDRNQTYLFIDEFPKLNYNAPVEDFEGFCELGRSKGVRVVICIQTPEQVKGLYGPERAASILGNCGNKLIYRVSDAAGAEECSRMLPHYHGYEKLITSGGMSLSMAESRVDRPLVQPSDIQFLPLADWRLGWKGYGVCANLRRNPAWEDRITPEFLDATLNRGLARQVVELEHEDMLLDREQQELLLPYEQCLRSADEQRLEPLNPREVAEFGLTFDPDGHSPLTAAT